MPTLGLHHVHLKVRDLPGALAFAQDFGLLEAEHSKGRTYLRGVGPHSYSLVLEEGPVSELGCLVFEVDSEDDLDRAIREHGASPRRDLDGPGGGVAVDLVDPNGIAVTLVHGVAGRTPDPLPKGLLLNQGYDKPRRGVFQEKSPLGPPPILRLGHAVLCVKDFAASDAWYCAVLGLIPSDFMYMSEQANKVVGFYRVNRGEEHVDHHVFAMFTMPDKVGLHHISFEVPNLEAQFMARRWLTQRRHNEVWGVGRHPLGSHVFDVWKDPNGFRYETFSDTDLLDASVPTGVHAINEVNIDLWSDRDAQIYFA